MTNMRTSPYTLAILRIVTGFLLLLHGLQKGLNILGGIPQDVPANVLILLRTAGWIETIGGALIIAGLFTPAVAFVLCGEMAVAFFVGHVARMGKFLPIQNGGAEAVLNCFIFLYLFTAGAGAWSIDSLRKEKAIA